MKVGGAWARSASGAHAASLRPNGALSGAPGLRGSASGCGFRRNEAAQGSLCHALRPRRCCERRPDRHEIGSGVEQDRRSARPADGPSALRAFRLHAPGTARSPEPQSTAAQLAARLLWHRSAAAQGMLRRHGLQAGQNCGRRAGRARWKSPCPAARGPAPGGAARSPRSRGPPPPRSGPARKQPPLGASAGAPRRHGGGAP